MRTPHQNLIESFPDLADAFHHLKINDFDFKQVLKHYEELDNKINLIDNGGGAVEPLYFEELKKQRVVLKDQVYQYMRSYQDNLSINLI